MNHRVIATIMVVVMVFGAIAPAAPIQSSGPPEPEAPLPKGYDPAAPMSSFPHAVGIPAHKFFISDSPGPLQEPVRLLPHTGSPHKVLHVRAETASIESELMLAQRCEPLDLSLRIATDALPRRYAALQPTLSTYTVTTTADSGPGSLRQCLLDATPGTMCSFDPVAFPPGAPATIALLSPLPSIVTDSLTIDGSNAGVVLNGSGLSAGDGLLVIGADGVIIRGLQIRNFPRHGIGLAGGASNVTIGGDRAIGAAPLGQGNLLSGNGAVGVWVEGVGTTGNQVLGNYIGTDASGMTALSNGRDGIGIGFGATDNVIGGSTAGAHNVISGNTEVGVWIQNSGTTGNQVLGNYIGTQASGMTALSNGRHGIGIGFGATNNVIGGSTAGAHNVISGNTEAGVWIQNSGTTGNQVLGNYIGTDASGAAALGNEFGIVISGGAANNVVGGNTDGARNVISGNTAAGIQFQSNETAGNQALGNYIGTDASGMTALGNGSAGIAIAFGATDNVIGGDTAGARNIISGNDTGVSIQDDGTTGNQVLGNYIGTNASGTVALGNNLVGVAIKWGASDNVVGGNTEGARNVISGNDDTGIGIANDGTSGNQVLGNYIGTDVSGAAALGNEYGIVILGGAANNVVGGNTAGARNVISGNTGVGIQIQDSGTTGNWVLGNYIGTDAVGMAPLGNNTYGVTLVEAQNNIIGGDTAGARNIISGHTEDGIFIQGEGATGNQVLGNYIGTNASGAVALGNFNGIRIGFGAKNNIIGGDASGARNIISGNTQAGIGIENDGTTGNQVLGNYIGTDAAGTAALGNGGGVVIVSGAVDNVVGGDTSGTRNVISGNTWPGIQIQDNGTTGNQVLGNYIGADVTGLVPLSNTVGVVIYSGAKNNVVGGDTAGARNIISGNTDVGVGILSDGTTGNQVLGNYIGVDATGLASLGNGYGVFIESGAKNNFVGGDAAGTRNIISGNTQAGVVVYNNGTTGNQVLGNYIGADATGIGLLGNGWDGVAIIFGAGGNRIGGNTPGAGNLISGNDDGVWLQGTRTTGNEVIGNDIVSNTLEGVYLGDGANANTVGVSNTIAYNGSAGVVVDGVTTRGNTVTRNSIHSNGELPIKFINTPIPILAPVLTTTLCSGTVFLPVTGSACPNCVIELYANPDERPGGTIFLAETTANASGDFTKTVTCALTYPYLSATATGSDGTTSEFYPGSTVTSRTMVFLPLVIRQTAPTEQQGIYGRVTYNGAGIAGIHLDLRFYDGAGWSTRATAVTAANGNYQFSSVPGLSAGQAYYVRYLNGQSGNADNPNYLYSWFAPSITSYTSGAGVSGGDFDIADVPLVSPSHGASVTLPTNFLWTRRSITNDSYKFVLYYPAQSQVAITNLLGYVQGITVNGLPSGWPSGGVYYWWAEVHHGDGTENYGEAYGANKVTISYSTVQTTQDIVVSPLTPSPGEGAMMYEHLLRWSFDRSR